LLEKSLDHFKDQEPLKLKEASAKIVLFFIFRFNFWMYTTKSA